MKLERTLQHEVELRGRGLHTGQETAILIRPASTGTGIVFVRTDFDEPVRIPATAEFMFEGEGRQTHDEM